MRLCKRTVIQEKINQVTNPHGNSGLAEQTIEVLEIQIQSKDHHGPEFRQQMMSTHSQPVVNAFIGMKPKITKRTVVRDLFFSKNLSSRTPSMWRVRRFITWTKLWACLLRCERQACQL